MTEKNLQNKIRIFLLRNGFQIVKKGSFMGTGAPDLIGLSLSMNKVIFIEVKRLKFKPTIIQNIWIQKLNKLKKDDKVFLAMYINEENFKEKIIEIKNFIGRKNEI